MKLFIVTCAIVLGFMVGAKSIKNKCKECKYFTKYSGLQDEPPCTNVCATPSAKAIDSNGVTELVFLGCEGCSQLVISMINRIHHFSFRNIIKVFSMACNIRLPNCFAFVATNEDTLIGAMYKYKRDVPKICRALHQC